MPQHHSFAPVDFESFHTAVLPGLLRDGRGGQVGRSAAHLAPLAIRLHDGRAFTYIPRPDGLEFVAGDEQAVDVIGLDEVSWQGFVHELEAGAGLLYSGRARALRGSALALMLWETPLRVLYHGRPAYDPAAIDLRDRHGGRLAVDRVFTLDSDRDDMAHFLATAGYLFVRGVFAGDEIAAMRDEVDELRAEARKGDKLSWWGKNDRDEEVLCRITRAASRPRLGALRHDSRLLGLKDLAREPLVYRRGEGDGVAVIFKEPGIREGLGDLPWHRDCGMGGHAVMCPTAIASVFLTEGSPSTGELTFLPGSRNTAFNAHDPLCRGTLPAAHFHAQPGDVTLHYGDTIHAAPPPSPGQSEYRVSAILGYSRPDAHNHRGDGSYNEALHRRDDGQVEHLNDLAEKL